LEATKEIIYLFWLEGFDPGKSIIYINKDNELLAAETIYSKVDKTAVTTNVLQAWNENPGLTLREVLDLLGFP